MYGLITFLLIMNLVIGFLLSRLFQEFWPRQQRSAVFHEIREIHSKPESPAREIEISQQPDLIESSAIANSPKSVAEIMNLLATRSLCASFDVWPQVCPDAITFTHVETTLPSTLAAIPSEVIALG